MRVAALLRRIDPKLVDLWYQAAGTALHVEGHKPHRREVAEHLVAQMGLDPSLVGQAIEDPTTSAEVKAEHDRVVALGGWGVPTLVFDNAHALFGPVLIDPPTGPAALRLWELVIGWLEFPNLYEIQHPKRREDLQAIATAFQPYVEARTGKASRRTPHDGPHNDPGGVGRVLRRARGTGGGPHLAEWEAPSLCPDWTVRGVFEHLVGIENALVSWVPDAANTPPPFRLAGTFANEVAGSDSPNFMECVRDALARRRRDLGVLVPSDLAQPSWTPAGPGTYGRFMEIRVFDFWVHERDITTPLARRTDDTGARAKSHSPKSNARSATSSARK